MPSDYISNYPEDAAAFAYADACDYGDYDSPTPDEYMDCSEEDEDEDADDCGCSDPCCPCSGPKRGVP